MGIALRDTYVLFHGVLFVDLSGKSSLAVKRPHLLINIFAVVVWHLHSAVIIIKSAVRHF